MHGKRGQTSGGHQTEGEVGLPRKRTVSCLFVLSSEDRFLHSGVHFSCLGVHGKRGQTSGGHQTKGKVGRSCKRQVCCLFVLSLPIEIEIDRLTVGNFGWGSGEEGSWTAP